MRTAATVFSVLLLTACASAPPPPPVTPMWQSIPANVLDAVCARLLDDGIGSSGAPIGVVRTTQPIVTSQALAAVGAMTRGAARRDALEEALRGAQRSIPVDLGGPSCAWRPIEKLDTHKYADAMVAEFSAPIVNPFGHGDAGILIRVSLGGTHPSWYWIPLAPYQGGWAIGRVLPLLM